MCSVVLGGLAASASGDFVFEPVDFSKAHNFRLQDLHSNFPEGIVELGGVPFDIPKNTPFNIWLADPSFSNNEPVILDIPINVFGVDEVHSLINTIWGVADTSMLTLEFFGDGGGGDGPGKGDAYYRVDLVGNDDIREYLQGANINEINGETTTEVFLSNNGQKRLDKVFIEAGFDWREPGCSMCLAMNNDRLKPEERCASTSNRNFEGRQGFKGRTHLVSPAMAGAAAIAGHFVDIRDWK